jgi:hypothetical protein
MKAFYSSKYKKQLQLFHYKTLKDVQNRIMDSNRRLSTLL